LGFLSGVPALGEDQQAVGERKRKKYGTTQPLILTQGSLIPVAAGPKGEGNPHSQGKGAAVPANNC